MKDLIISTLLAIIIFILGTILNLKNATLNFLFQTIPIIIPTFVMWKNRPKNFLKLMIFIRRDIKFTYEVKVSNCKLDSKNFDNIISALLSFNNCFNGTNSKIINNHKDDLLFSSYIDVDTTNIEIDYYSDSETLTISSSDMISYRYFIKRIKLLNNNLRNSLSSVIYTKMLIKIKITFLSKIKKETRNPFTEKIFDGFESKILNFKYIAKNSSKITITNNSIEFLSNNIDSINYDINSELNPLGLFSINE